MADDSKTMAERLAVNGGEKFRATPFGPRWVFDETDAAQLQSVLDRAPKAWRNGEKIREFVSAFQTTFGVRNAVAAGSGTAAIHAAAGALGLRPGDEVITTPATDIGTVVGLLQNNLIPVFADWAEGEFNTCPIDIERRITDRTRALLVVHLFGFPCDMGPIMALAKRRGLAVIEDCAQAHLAEYKGAKVGTFGDLACWSFGLKTLTTEQGGMVSAADAELAAEARGFLSKGSVKEDGAWIPYARLGTFAPMTDLQAAVGVAQIARLEDATARRKAVAGELDDAFAQMPGVTLPNKRSGDRNVYYMYPYHFDQAAIGVSVEKFIEALRAEGISDAFGPYLKGRPLHQQRLFLNLDTYGGAGFPLRDAMGVLRVDYASLSLPRVERLLPGLGFFHMRNSFTAQDGSDIAGAVLKVARGLGAAASRISLIAARPRRGPGDPAAQPQSPPPKALAAPAAVAAPATDAVPHSPPPVEAPIPGGVLELSQSAGSGVENARRLQAALDALAGVGGLVRLPPGRFPISRTIKLQRRRNLILEGAGGNLLDGGTRLIFDDPDAGPGLDLLTVIHSRFRAIAFEAITGGAAIAISCDEEGPDGTSSLSLQFSDCTFMAQAGSPGVCMQDCAAIQFVNCWLRGAGDAAWIGAPQRSGCKSISNGLANSITFDACLIFAPTRLIRASAVAWSGCHFSRPQTDSPALIDAGLEATEEASALTVRASFALEGGATSFVRAGPMCAGLVLEANRIRGFQHALLCDAGAAGVIVRANVLENMAEGSAISGPDADILMEGNVQRQLTPKRVGKPAP